MCTFAELNGNLAWRTLSPMNSTLRRGSRSLSLTARRVAVGLGLALALSSTGCTITSHGTRPATVGVPSSSDAMLAVIDEPGPVTVETVDSADWAVPLEGLVNVDHPRARAARLVDRAEPIQVYFHALHHPTRGLFVVDTGVERARRDAPDKAALRGLVVSIMHLDAMQVRMPLGDWLDARKEPLRGVLMTHLHPDHVTGMADVPDGTPVFTGPGEAGHRDYRYVVLQPNTDRALAGKPPLEEWQFQPDPGGRFAGVIDVFGDGTVWALSVPGHSEGSTAYVVRSPEGPVLFTGDVSHTRWGWENDVEPGTLTENHAGNATSLAQLRALVAAHPSISVRLGHQR
jgi:glyoxylase-like metal-dependent hydrolase (beta-lactamase superfamily II)